MIFDRNFHYTIQLHLVIISSSRKEPCGLWPVILEKLTAGKYSSLITCLSTLCKIICQRGNQNEVMITA